MTESHTFMPGQIIHDRYRIDAVLATGGQGHVYRAQQLELGREVAIKLLRNHGSPEVKARMVKRFEQEAKLLSNLKDPHTITLYDFGRLEDGALFMVFEYVDGISLKDLIANEGKIEPYRVAKILRQTLSSLHEAHTMGVLHRDLKPANIMVYEHAGRKDQVKLLDFGIAKILREEAGTTSNKGLTGERIIGTPRYIAPELLLKEEPGPSSDLYSLGLIGYELLVGRPAITARNHLEIIAQQIDPNDFKLPKNVNIPDNLRAIINTLLKKKSDERYQEVIQVSLALKRWMNRSLPDADSEVFDADITPGDHIEAMNAYRKRTESKQKLRVVLPEKNTQDLTPRSAFSQNIVFEGKPGIKAVDGLLQKSLKANPSSPPSSALSGSSATVTQAHHKIVKPATRALYVAPQSPPTAALEPVIDHNQRARPQHSQHKIAIAAIVTLVVLILIVIIILAVFIFAI